MSGKNIVLCSDGTGNSAMKGRGTNVFKLYEALDLNNQTRDQNKNCQQLAFYDDGVGTDRFVPLKLFGGMFGWGFSRNVCELYAHLVRVYEDGDRIYLFGFSRGAYTVRALAEWITSYKLLDRKDEKYKNDIDLWEGINDFYKECHGKKAPSGQEQKGVHVEFMGVWDTVSAVGLPPDLGFIEILNKALKKWIPGFHDGKPDLLDEKVKRVCHALSIDDERRTFHPLMWNEKGEKVKDKIQQVWFPGVHTNVGGGYEKQGMSLVSLVWMMEQAQNAGSKPPSGSTPAEEESKRLRFISSTMNYYREQQNVHDKLYNSRAGSAGAYRYAPRDIEKLYLAYGTPSSHPKLHISAIERIAWASDGANSYAPGNIPAGVEVISADSKLSRKIEETLKTMSKPGVPPLLDQVKKQVTWKRRVHEIWLWYPALVLVVLIIFMLADASLRIGIMKANFWLAVALIWAGFLVINYWGGLALEKQMQQVFSLHWWKMTSRLREQLTRHRHQGVEPRKQPNVVGM